MTTKFADFKSRKEAEKFNLGFNELCESIVASGMDFNTYWKEHGLPALINSQAQQTTEELLVEFNPLSAASWKGLGSKIFGGGQQAPAATTTTAPTAPVADPRIEKARAGLEGSVNAIKKRFMVAMKDFHTAISNDAKKSGDAQQWKLADVFYKKMMATMQPQADQFLQNLKLNILKKGQQPAYQQNFQKQAGQMQANMQAQNTAAMKAKLQDPNVQARLDNMRTQNQKWTPQELQQWAQEFSKNGNLRADQLINPDGTPTQTAMNYLPQKQDWLAKRNNRAAPVERKPAPPMNVPMRTAGAQQPNNVTVNGQKVGMAEESANPLADTLRNMAGKKPKNGSILG